MPDTEHATRAAIVAGARALNTQNLSPGTSGNVSVRWRDGFLITPSALPYFQTEPRDIIYVGLDGQPNGPRRPSSEWRMHRDVYAARPDAGAVIHAHAAFATTLACHERGIPSFHYMVAAAGGEDIRCAPYAPFGTQDLSDLAMQALASRRACLLGHHGLLTLGETLEAAMQLAVEVESLAQQYWQALQLGEPPLLTPEQMRDVLDRFVDYRAD
jgi:L-fuculose-phosphate aldolase